MTKTHTHIALWLASASLIFAGSSLAVLQQDQSNQQQNQSDAQKKKNQSSDKKNNQQQGNANSQNPNTQQNPAPPPKSGTDSGKPAPLFGGTVGLKSSRQTKDTATMGFNGVDPNGQVAQSFLTATATGTDNAKAQMVSTYKSDPAELAQFIQDGNLNPNAAPQKSSK